MACCMEYMFFQCNTPNPLLKQEIYLPVKSESLPAQHGEHVGKKNNIFDPHLRLKTKEPWQVQPNPRRLGLTGECGKCLGKGQVPKDVDDEGQQLDNLEVWAFFVVSFDVVIGLRGQHHICSKVQIMIGINSLRVAIVIVQIEPSFSWPFSKVMLRHVNF